MFQELAFALLPDCAIHGNAAARPSAATDIATDFDFMCIGS
jgi:hypothetical protein